MTCLFDHRWIGDHGIGRFARELSERLPNQKLIAYGKPTSPFAPFRYKNYKFRKGDWMLSPGIVAPFFPTLPYILTIHDLNHVDIEANYTPLKYIYYCTILKKLSSVARAILTVSEFSKQRIVEFLGVDEAKVFNVSNGISRNFNVNIEPYKPGFPYLLCVGNRQKHKNEARIIEAFAQAKISENTRLIFTGNPCHDLLNKATVLGIQRRLIFTKRIGELELAKLYRGAIALVFTSHYEGFGLPIIEAFATATPVITSKISAMPETAGDAAILVDPNSIDEITKSIEIFANEPDKRKIYSEKGLHRSQFFSWEQVANNVRYAVSQVNNDPSTPLLWN